MAPPPSRSRAGPGLRLTERDHELLGFVAEHRLVLARQLEKLTPSNEHRLTKRLHALVDHEYLSRGCVFGERHYQIRRAGLDALGSRLPVPRFHLGGYKHDVGVAWLWLAARRGMFGPLGEILGERHLRSHDRAVERSGEPYGIRLGGFDRWGYERLHYPDLLLVDPSGLRLALELELTPKGRDRRERILGGYGADGRIDAVLYLVEDDPRGRAIRRLVAQSAREMGLTDRVGIQLVRPIRLGGARSTGPEVKATRRPSGAHPAVPTLAGMAR